MSAPASVDDYFSPAPARRETLRDPNAPLPTDGPSVGGVGFRGFTKSLPGFTGGLAGAGTGAYYGGIGGAAIGGPFAEITGPVGAIGGALVGGFGGGYAADSATDAILPDRLKTLLGWDQKTQAADEAAHPYVAMGSRLLPQALAMRPSANLFQAGLGAAIGGGTEAGQEMWQGDIDPFKIGMATVAGAAFGGDPRRFASPIFHLAPNTVAAIRNIPIGPGRTAANIGARSTLEAAVPDAAHSDDAGLMQAADSKLGDNTTPDEKAARSVLEGDAFVKASNPLQPTPAGEAEHGARLAATQAALLENQPPPSFRATGASSAPYSGDDAVAARMIHLESRGDPTASNPFPGQTASGLGGITDDSWKNFRRKYFGETADQAMAVRSDSNAQRATLAAMIKEERHTLGAAGQPVTDGNVRLLHWLGPRGIDVLRAEPGTPIDALLPKRWIDVNPELRGKTAGEVVALTDRQMGGHGVEQASDVSRGTDVADAAAPADEPMLAAGEDIADPVAEPVDRPDAIDVASAGPRAQRSPEDLIRFLTRSGGISDNEGNDLAGGRDLQVNTPGLGKLIRPDGMSIDKAGELLWERGWIDNADPSNPDHRPTTAQVLDLIEQAQREKLYHPNERAEVEAKAAQADNARAEISAGEEFDAVVKGGTDHGVTYDIGAKERRWAIRRMAEGMTADEAIQHLFDEPPEALAEAIGTTPERLRRASTYSEEEDPFAFFERIAAERQSNVSAAVDPILGAEALEAFKGEATEGRDAQRESLDHDLRMMLKPGDPQLADLMRDTFAAADRHYGAQHRAGELAMPRLELIDAATEAKTAPSYDHDAARAAFGEGGIAQIRRTWDAMLRGEIEKADAYASISDEMLQKFRTARNDILRAANLDRLRELAPTNAAAAAALEMELAKFKLDDGEARTIADVLEEIDADHDAIAKARACMTPTKGAA